MGDNALQNLSRRFKEIKNKYDNNFELLRMIPTDDAIDAYPKGCITKNPGTNNFPIGMQLLNNMPQTYETCKIGASLEFSNIKYQESQKIKSNTIEKTKGLLFKIIKGYFMDNPSYFLNGNYGNPPEEIKIGETQNMGDISSSTNAHINTKMDSISIEWFGYIIPDLTGNWKFNMGSDDGSYMWLGNHALYDYKTSNAQIKNGGLHKVNQKEAIIYMIKDQIYPIRIQYGNNTGNMAFNFSISSPSGETKTNSIIFILKENGKLYEMKQRYFALVDRPGNIGKYSCYIADSGTSEDSNKELKIQNISSTSETQSTVSKVIWYGLDEKNRDEVSKIRSGNYAAFDNALGGLVIYDSKNTPLKTFKVDNPHPTNPGFNAILMDSGGSVYLKIMYTKNDGSSGNMQIANSSLKPEAISSEVFRSEVDQKKTCDTDPSKINYGQKITDKTSVIKTDYKYKLTIDSNGNLVLLCAFPGCSITAKNAQDQNIIKSTANAKYLYALDIDEKENKYFYTDNLNKSMENVPNTSDSKKGGILGFTDFIPVGNYIPESTNNTFTIVKNLNECEKKCKQTKTCDSFYYQEKTDNKKYCKLNQGTDGIIPYNSTNPITSTTIKSSQLYIKNKNLDMPSNYMANPIQTSTIDTYDKYSNYSGHTVLGSQFSTPKIVGPESTKEWKDANKDLQKMLWGTRGREGFTSSTIEGLTYLNRNCSGNTADGCIRDISNNKIAPLKEMAANYDKALQQLSQNRADLASKITNYNNLKQNLLDNNNTYKYSDAVDQTNPDKKTLLDGMNDDANEMLLQQNNVYLMGTLTTASLLILAIILSSK